MVYRNKKSGATFATSCVCEGEDWEEVKASASAPKAKGGKKQEAAEAETSDGDAESP